MFQCGQCDGHCVGHLQSIITIIILVAGSLVLDVTINVLIADDIDMQ